MKSMVGRVSATPMPAFFSGKLSSCLSAVRKFFPADFFSPKSISGDSGFEAAEFSARGATDSVAGTFFDATWPSTTGAVGKASATTTPSGSSTDASTCRGAWSGADETGRPGVVGRTGVDARTMGVGRGSVDVAGRLVAVGTTIVSETVAGEVGAASVCGAAAVASTTSGALAEANGWPGAGAGVVRSGNVTLKAIAPPRSASTVEGTPPGKVSSSAFSAPCSSGEVATGVRGASAGGGATSAATGASSAATASRVARSGIVAVTAGDASGIASSLSPDTAATFTPRAMPRASVGAPRVDDGGTFLDGATLVGIATLVGDGGTDVAVVGVTVRTPGAVATVPGLATGVETGLVAGCGATGAGVAVSPPSNAPKSDAAQAGLLVATGDSEALAPSSAARSPVSAEGTVELALSEISAGEVLGKEVVMQGFLPWNSCAPSVAHD
ncbi:MAG: hypothetical protein HZA32_12305 [Opitutae bacterium]|nr:hypothetical protein [Opitutae bacterium]